MQEKTQALLLSDIRVPFDAPDEEALKIAQKKLKSARLDARLRFHIYKKSLDARRKHAILKVCSVLAEADEPFFVTPALLQKLGARPFSRAVPEVRIGEEPLDARPLVVGMGPAGLFAALLLAEWGYAPIIIDRGDDVAARASAVARFRDSGVLDTESNIQFGAGGAGTFSDGKLRRTCRDRAKAEAPRGHRHFARGRAEYPCAHRDAGWHGKIPHEIRGSERHRAKRARAHLGGRAGGGRGAACHRPQRARHL